MEGLTFRASYFDDRRARDAFKTFLRGVHGLDLGRWEQSGFWDERYRPFSLFDGDRIVASVCLYSMDMTVGGRRRTLGQFSGVGTLPSFRRRGLARWLTERAMAWAAPAHDGFFLFADDGAVPFYARCGFERLAESAAVVAVEPPAARSGLRKIDAGADRDLERIYRLACERTPVSDALGVLNAKLLMFHALYALRDCAYEIADLDVVVFFAVEGDRLTLFDVVGREVPPFAALHPYLSSQRHREVCFRFLPDKLAVAPTRWTPVEGNNTHVHGLALDTDAHWLFPQVAHA